jgi:putative membrane protein
MTRRVLRRIPLAALCTAALALACSKRDKSADSASVAGSAAAASAAAAPPAAPAPTLTDANIAAILDAANASDSADGSIAATKGTNAEVRTFGKAMIRDHHALRKAGQDLAKKLNLTLELPAGDTSAVAAKRWHDSLSALPKGASLDQAYIDHEVVSHETVLRTAQTALGAAQNAELKSFIQKAAPNIQAHLDMARSIQSKLSGAGAAAAGGAAPAGGAAMAPSKDTTKRP